MRAQDQLAEQGLPVQRFEYEDSVELVVDFGPGETPSVDRVGETIIILADGTQYEIETDQGAEVFISNGVLTIEVDR